MIFGYLPQFLILLKSKNFLNTHKGVLKFYKVLKTLRTFKKNKTSISVVAKTVVRSDSSSNYQTQAMFFQYLNDLKFYLMKKIKSNYLDWNINSKVSVVAV